MDAMTNLLTRRSIRKYKAEMLPREVIEKIIEAGVYAPTGHNHQSPIIVAVTDRAVRDKLSALNARVLNTDSDPFYGAPVVLNVLAENHIDIEYMYSLFTHQDGNAYIVFRLTDEEGFGSVIDSHGLALVSAEELGLK